VVASTGLSLLVAELGVRLSVFGPNEAAHQVFSQVIYRYLAEHSLL
jgi:hypothetical protein